MASETNVPNLVNMLTCDGAHRNPGSGKWSLLGLFNSISTSGFPTVHPQMFVYLAVQGKGKVPLRMQVVAGDRKEEPLYKIEAELTVGDPRIVAELVVPFSASRSRSLASICFRSTSTTSS